MSDDESIARSYDDAPYSSYPFPFTHPSRIAAMGRLMGLDAPPVARCSVLELGCAGGGNLVPMAMALPDARVVGIDLSGRQIADANELAKALGLTNVEFRQANIRDIGDDFGRFDYIIAHGVFSWVPPDVQEKLLSVCSRNLSDRGVAFVSFNTYPGWFARGMIRELMRLHVRDTAEPVKCVAEARALLQELDGWFAQQNTPFAQLIRSELEGSKKWTDNYVLHEYLSDFNEPLYFHQFIGRIAAHELCYVCDADPSVSTAATFPRALQKSLTETAQDAVEFQQFIDIVSKRTMRKALLCHAEVAPEETMSPWRLRGLYLAAQLRQPTENGGEFETQHGRRFVSPDPAAAAALRRLADAWPATMPFDALTANLSPPSQQMLAATLLGLLQNGGAEIHAHPPAFARHPGDKPVGSLLARLQAQHSVEVTNLRHETVELDEAHRHLLGQLDGSCERATLTNSDVALAHLARSALLLA